MKTLLLFLMAFGISAFSLPVEKKFENKSNHLIQYLNQDKTCFFNWAGLFYFGTFKKDYSISQTDNFIEKPILQQSNALKTAKTQVFQHLFSLEIDNEMDIKDLLKTSETFDSLLRKAVFDSEIFLPPSHSGENRVKLSGFFPFPGNNQLIELILKSGYYIEREKLRPLQTKYTANPNKKIVIEARHLKLKPSLFPQIYTYDGSGNKILIYSLAHSNFSEISKKGYAHYLTNLSSIKIKEEKAFYCPAVELSGTKKTDIVINREDYLKLFSSPISLKSLSEGNLYIIISNNTFVKKEKPKREPAFR